jgi:hypothetical protein
MQPKLSLILLFAEFIKFTPISAQCPYLQCLPEHNERVWKIEDLRLRSTNDSNRLYADFTLYRTRSNGNKHYTGPAPNSCSDLSEWEKWHEKEEWNVCNRVNLAPEGEELFPQELQRWLKWRATELDERPRAQNSSLTYFNRAKFEIVQGLPWPA